MARAVSNMTCQAGRVVQPRVPVPCRKRHPLDVSLSDDAENREGFPSMTAKVPQGDVHAAPVVRDPSPTPATSEEPARPVR